MEKQLGRIAELYNIAIEQGDTRWHRGKGLLNKILPDYWYETNFQYRDLKINIWEWRHGLALNDFLDSITIYFKNRKVYQAQVHRFDASLRIANFISKRNDWIEAIDKTIQEYI